MKLLGYLLITVGFLVGSVSAVQTAENSVDWAWFVPAFVLGVIGVALARIGTHREASHETKLSGDFETLVTSIDRIAEKISRLDADKANLDPYVVHERIDELLRDDLAAFADARESIGHLYTLGDYAEVMNSFAAGERYVNRVWSASIDGWIDELQQYLGLAKEQFLLTRAKVQALKG